MATQYSDEEIQQQLQDAAAKKGVAYDKSDAADVAHRDNTGDALAMELGKYDQRATNTPNQDEHSNSSMTAPGAGGVASQWTGGGGSGANGSGGASDILSQIRSQLAARDSADATRRDSLYGQLSAQAGQSTNIDPNDPVIKNQTDAYRAEQTRGQRDYMANLAEKAGPDANLATEGRMSAEKVGQNTSGFQASLMGQELTQRRAQISDSLNSMRGMLTADQQASLQQQLAVIDNAMKEQQLGVQSQLGNRGLDVDWQKALMNNSQFMAQLGLSAEDRASYWDAVRSGAL